MPQLLTKLMSAGLGAGLANAFCADTADSQTATGTNQATAFETSTAIVRFTTVASGTGCLLDNGARGDAQYIVNAGANTLLVYPHVGGSINGAATNAAFSLAAGSWAGFDRYTDTAWVGSSNDAANTTFTPSGTGAVSRPVQDKERDIVNAKDYGCVVDGVTDDATKLNAILLQHAGKTIYMGPGTCLVGATILLPDNTILKGSGRQNTTIKLKNSANCDLLNRQSTGQGAGIEDLRFDANGANNTVGGVFWLNSATNASPALRMVNVDVTNSKASASINAALGFQGASWIECWSVRVFNNLCPGIWNKSPDSLFNGVYTSGNSGQNVVIQNADACQWIGCYFGGGGSQEEVLIMGSVGNKFIGCQNGNVSKENYKFIDSGGISCSGNEIIGGSATNASQLTTNTYDHISFQDGSTKNNVVGVFIDNTTANKGRYGIAEAGTATANKLVAAQFGTLGTGNTNLRAAGTSTIDNIKTGTWTPTIQGDGTAGVQTYGSQVGWYRKIGDLVIAGCYITMSAKDAATAGNLQIAGLPFTSSATASNFGPAAISQYNFDFPSVNYSQVGGYVAVNGTVANLVVSGKNIAAATLAAAQLLANSNIMATFTYQASS